MWLTFYVIVIIALTDTFGMLVGTSIGRHSLTQDLTEEDRRGFGRLAGSS